MRTSKLILPTAPPVADAEAVTKKFVVDTAGLLWSYVTEATTAENAQGYLMEGTFTLTMPENPVVGNQVGWRVLAGVITIARNGQKIEGLSQNLVLDIPGAGGVWVFQGEGYGWVNITEVNGGGGGGGSDLQLGETETTAHRGDHGKSAYDHSQEAHAPSDATVAGAAGDAHAVITTGNPHSVTAAEVGAIPTSAIGTDPEQIIQLDAEGKLPAVDGSQLTGLPGGTGDAHAGATGNPHGTTAAEVSAVATSGNETVSGVKTFASYPLLPEAAPTADREAVPKDYVDGKTTTTTTVIAADDWSVNAVTKNVSGVTTTSILWVSPAPASYADYIDAEIRSTAQGAGTISFECETAPTAAVTVNIVIGN